MRSVTQRDTDESSDRRVTKTSRGAKRADSTVQYHRYWRVDITEYRR